MSGVRAASSVAFGSAYWVVERVVRFEREMVLRASGRGDLVVVGEFEVWHGDAELLPVSNPAEMGTDLDARMGRFGARSVRIGF